MIQSNEGMGCPVINTKQMNSYEADGAGSAIKCQYTEEPISVLNLKSFLCLWNKNNQALLIWP